MHISKIFSIFAVSLLAVPTLSFVQDSFEKRSRSPNAHLPIRAAPPLGLAATPKQCNIKLPTLPRVSGTMTAPKAKRALIGVNAGSVSTGTATDILYTNSLQTCIGVVAISSTGGKVMAHINGWNDANQDYEAQLQSFETAAHALGGSLKVYVSYPNFMQGGAALQVLLAEMITKVDTAAQTLDRSRQQVSRTLDFVGATGPGGEMRLPADGTVVIDGCTYSH